MLKIEYVWRELLFQAIECQNSRFSTSDLSQKFNLSTSMVFHALKPLRKLHMVEIGKRNSYVVDVEKFLFFSATKRNFYKDVIYETRSELSPRDLENSMPQDVVPTCYSAYNRMFNFAPADYDRIYYYAYDLEDIQRRFPLKKTTYPNLIILRPDPFLKIYKNLPLAQLFADLWNLTEWQSHDFTNALLLKIKTKVGL